MAYLLGIDVGTSSAKALIIDEDGHCIRCEKSDYDIMIPHSGYAEQDCNMLWEAVCAAVRTVVSEARVRDNLKAVGITGQMHGLVLLDKNKRPLRPMIIWADRRSTKQTKALKKSWLEARVGNPVSTGFCLPSLLWVKENEPEIYKKTAYVLLPKDYIRYKLCGSLDTDYSDATGTLLFNLQEGGWDQKILDQYSIKKEIMPECKWSCEISGEITSECHKTTELPVGIPVVYGGGDTPMQLVGNGIIRNGQLNTNIGTANQINCICGFLPEADPRVNIFHHIPKQSWIVAGAGLNGGIVMKWLQNNVFTGFNSFEQMSQAAELSPAGANGIVWLPFLNGERSPYMNENAKAILFGMTLSHTRNDIIRAAMESVVFSFRDCIEVFKNTGLDIQEEIIASGGGAKSRLWLQMQADILQKAIRVTEGDEDAGKGAAIAAGVGCGLYASLEEGCARAVHFSEQIYEPDVTKSGVYDERFQTYLALYENNKKLFV